MSNYIIFNGSRDTRKHSGGEYELESFSTLEERLKAPSCVEKSVAAAAMAVPLAAALFPQLAPPRAALLLSAVARRASRIPVCLLRESIACNRPAIPDIAWCGRMNLVATRWI